MSDLPDDRLTTQPNGAASPHQVPAEEQLPNDKPRPTSIELPRPIGFWHGLWRGQLHCPNCGAMIEESLIGLSTLLGPALLQCRKCRQLLVSHRGEWRDRSTAGRVGYVVATLFYISVCTGIAFLATLCACAILRTPALWVSAGAAVLWAIIIAAVQVLRVVRSLQRTQPVERPAVVATFWSLDLFSPQKAMRGMILSAIILACLARLVASG